MTPEKIIIREISEVDSSHFISYRRQLAGETSMMLAEVDEIDSDADRQARRIREMRASQGDGVLLAEKDGRIVGHIAVFRGRFRRDRHSASIVIGILRANWGNGIAGRLISAVEEWARHRDITRIELSVMEHNTRAISVYERHGFLREGKKIFSLCVDGKPVNELLMAKTL